MRGSPSLLENLIALRYVRAPLADPPGGVHREVRDSDFDPNLREFSITDRGISMAGIFQGTEQVLSGLAHDRPTEDRLSDPEETSTTVLVVGDQPLIAMALARRRWKMKITAC